VAARGGRQHDNPLGETKSECLYTMTSIPLIDSDVYGEKCSLMYTERISMRASDTAYASLRDDILH
jgi:hypothetical protein